MPNLIDKLVDFLNKDKEFRGYLVTIKSINGDNLAFCDIKMCKIYRIKMYLPYEILEKCGLNIGDKFIYFPPETDEEELTYKNIKLLNPS
ncbi:MAG: hypothetical protein KJ623_00665 [Nanoarchaeota archaeon]|nr:hypothetical protein [Nanoarchaeota archaeon]